MKMTSKNTPQPAEQPVFHKVAENLYRLESSDGYYALLKRGGKQFRRSLKTKDRKLADRRLNDLRAKIGCLKISADAKLNFEQAAKSVAGNEQTRIEFQHRQTPENVYQGTRAVFSESANPQHHRAELRPLG
jgi:hypothetical protein